MPFSGYLLTLNYPNMNRYAARRNGRLPLLVLSFFFCLNATATWSIIVVDEKTKEVGIAGASCTYSVYGIGAIVPGKGAVVVQAMSHPFPRMKAVQMIREGASPKDILAAMKNPDYEPEEQQYGLVCMSDLSAVQTYTGSEAPGYKGALTAKGISVQGNTLANAEVLKAVFDAAVKAWKEGRPLEEILMLALEAGAEKGGDKRCGEYKASSAFITVAKPNDDPKHPFLNLVVTGSTENRNAVTELRKRFTFRKK